MGKYGVLGDGVNLTARLKSLNSRYRTTLLCSDHALDFEGSRELFVTRPIGNLVLKGRTTPTPTYEVLGRRGNIPETKVSGAEAHTRAFEMLVNRHFDEAKQHFVEAQNRLSVSPETSGGHGHGDGPSAHLIRLCEDYLKNPPPD